MKFKKVLGVILAVLMLSMALASCDNTDYSEPSGQIAKEKYYFHAIVVEVYDRSIMVTPVEGATEGNSSGLISVSLTLKSGDVVEGIEVGDKVRITYNGQIMESYPAQIAGAFEIVVVEKDAADATPITGAVAEKYYFKAKVLEVYDGSMLVIADEETSDQMAFGEVVVHLNLISGEEIPNIKVGDTVGITFNGQVMQSYPPQIGGVHEIVVITE